VLLEISKQLRNENEGILLTEAMFTCDCVMCAHFKDLFSLLF